MATKAEIADVLETAADLYEAERVEWCLGSWGRNELITSTKGDLVPRVTACASSALALASGLHQAHARMLENVIETGITAGIGLSEPEKLYLDVRKHVDGRLGWRLPAWNDLTRTEPRLNLGPIEFEIVDGAYMLKANTTKASVFTMAAIPVRTKAQVIELFKGLAKDLRNEE